MFNNKKGKGSKKKMKKIIILLLLLVVVLILVVVLVYVDEEVLIDIYLYGSINNMMEIELIVGGMLRVGIFNWILDFLGYRYYFVCFLVRYGY